MKILFYSSKSTYSGKSFGGAERSMTVMAEAMADLGHDVHFLSGRDNLRFAKAKRINENKVEVHFLPVFKFFLQRFKLLRSFSEYIRRLIFQNYLSKEFINFDIVYAYNEYPALYQIVQWREFSQSRIKIVYRVAGLYWHENILKAFPTLKPQIEGMFNKVDLVNYISPGIKDLMNQTISFNQYNFTFKRELVLDIGVEMAGANLSWSVAQKWKFKVLMVARFSEYQKRQDILVKAFEKWNNPNAQLIFVGDGPKLNQIKSEIEKSSYLKDSVEFMGFLGREEVIKELLESSVFCMCTDYEGLSKAIVEALSLGVPLLLSDVLAINSYITSSENGVLVNNTVEAWVSALDKIYNASKEDLKALSLREIAYAKEHFDVTKNAKKYMEAFQSLIEA